MATTLRPQEEIEAQLEHRQELLTEAVEEGNAFLIDTLREQIITLQWVLGIDQSRDIHL